MIDRSLKNMGQVSLGSELLLETPEKGGVCHLGRLILSQLVSVPDCSQMAAAKIPALEGLRASKQKSHGGRTRPSTYESPTRSLPGSASLGETKLDEPWDPGSFWKSSQSGRPAGHPTMCPGEGQLGPWEPRGGARPDRRYLLLDQE